MRTAREYNVAGDKNEPDAAIFAQDSLSVTGNGTLTVAGNHNHGIRAQDILAVTGGTLNVTAVGDALIQDHHDVGMQVALDGDNLFRREQMF